MLLTRLQVPWFAERLLGITVPEAGRMYACSYEGVHELALADPVLVTTDDTHAEDYDFLGSKGQTLGLHGGTPVLQAAGSAIAYSFDPEAASQSIHIRRGSWASRVEFPTDSGDWFYASLSTCGTFLVMAEPYRLHVYHVS
jgi:hypothetical protein